MSGKHNESGNQHRAPLRYCDFGVGYAENAGPEKVGPENGGRTIIPESQKVENAGLKNSGPRQLSDSSLKLTCASTAVTAGVTSINSTQVLRVSDTDRHASDQHFPVLHFQSTLGVIYKMA